MSFLIRFITKNALWTFFVFLQIISVILIFTKNSMQRSFIAAQVSAFNAEVSSYIDEGANYLKLKQINEDLVAQNKILLEQVYGKDGISVAQTSIIKDSLAQGQSYTIIDAEVIQNSINRDNNYFTINRGEKQGVEPKMGVIAPNGIAGIVVNATQNYALVQSVLSTKNIRINTALKNAEYFGTLTWNGEDARLMNLSDIPKYVPLKVGDTIVTDGKSSIFPKGLMVGRVAGYEVDTKTGYWAISVELSQKMGQLNKVFLVKNLKREELNEIQEILETTIKEDGQ
ncbi:MAG: rod shape-determining protein MreC [Flavobacteriaceae bacterium]|nr:rod shape-determining protein MreC [Flavobacteriaceae bacterium]